MEPKEFDEIQKMVTKAIEAVEDKLGSILKEAIEGIDRKVDLAVDLNVQSKAAFESVPALIQSQLTENIKAIGEELSKQFEEKVKVLVGGGGGGGGGGGAPGDGFSLNSLLSHSDQIIGMVNAFRSPTTEAAMLSQMNLIMKWHVLLSKVEKGGGSGDELTSTIAKTFTEKPE